MLCRVMRRVLYLESGCSRVGLGKRREVGWVEMRTLVPRVGIHRLGGINIVWLEKLVRIIVKVNYQVVQVVEEDDMDPHRRIHLLR